jgi:hypothetical protein
MTHCAVTAVLACGAGLQCWPAVLASPEPPIGLVIRNLPLQLIPGPCCLRFQLVPKAAKVCGILVAS